MFPRRRESVSTSTAAAQRRQDPVPLPRVEPPERVLARSHTDSTIQWGRAQTQTLVDLAPLASYLNPDCSDAILQQPAPGTEMELADCCSIPDSLVIGEGK